MTFSQRKIKMKLSLKQKALLFTLGMLGLSFIGVGAIVLILETLPAEVIAKVFMFGFIGWFVYLLYCITLSRLEYEETLKKINEKG
jgi:hypothetical protein